MRTDNPPSLAKAVARFRARLAQVRRSIRARGALTRGLLALGLITALAVLGYQATAPASVKYLGSGRRFSTDDQIAISHALEAQHFDARDFRIDDEGRIEVASGRLDQAAEIVAKLSIGPHALAELQQKDSGLNVFVEGPLDREERLNQKREQILATMIQRLPGIVSAYVTINRPKLRGRGHAPAHATAFVYVEAEGGREISPNTVQSIENLMALEPDLRPDAVTVCDVHGRRYVEAGNPATNRHSHLRAREEKLSHEILEHLDWVKGVRVTVQLVPTSAPTPAPATAPAPTVEEPRWSEPEVVPNQPLELPEPTPTPTPATAVAPAPAPPKSADELAVARVWVTVPRSFYYLKALPNLTPSLDDLQPIVTRTETLIRTAIAHVVPPGEASEVVIDTIPDDVPPSRPLMATAVPEARRSFSWWACAAVAGASAALVLAAVTGGLLASRRPAVRLASASASAPRHFERDGDPDPEHSASERVRELIRLNPESAAGVLQRWIGQGGRLP